MLRAARSSKAEPSVLVCASIPASCGQLNSNAKRPATLQGEASRSWAVHHADISCLLLCRFLVIQILRFVRFAGKGKTLGQNSRPLQPQNKRNLDYVL